MIMTTRRSLAITLAIGSASAAPALPNLFSLSLPLPTNLPAFTLPPLSLPTGLLPFSFPWPGQTTSTTTVAPATTTTAVSSQTSIVATTSTTSSTILIPTTSSTSLISSETQSSTSSAPTASPTGFEIGAAVNTTSGVIIGHEAPGTDGVSEYLGIPFAQPPVGQLRFAPPVAYTGSSTINASSFAADCACVPPAVPEGLRGSRLGNVLGDLAQWDDPLSEDCLYVNVWSKPQTGSAKKPVLVWIYGGGFNFGGSAVRAYNGKHFADLEDVVIVSINYRTNILGFSGAPGLTQNVGLLDQRLAIEWVRDNIAGFGGDVDRITLFGQSAGGMSIDLYNYAWTEDPIVAGTIMHSGNVYAYAIRQPNDAANAWYTASTAVGCGNATTSTADAVLECMRSSNTSWQAIEKAANTQVGLGSLLGSYGPTIDNKVVFSDYKSLAAAGKFIQKPSIIGNVNYEVGLLILIAAGAGQVYSQSVWDSIQQSVFTCPASYAAQNRAAVDVPIWRYYYSGAYPNLYIPTANTSQAWHTADIPVLLGTSEDTSGEAATDAEATFGNYFRHAWATFAADPASGLSSAPFAWPQYDVNTDSLILLGQDNSTVAAYGLAASVDQGC